MATKGKDSPLVHLFDGHVYIFRAYHSLPPMTASDGTPCNAAYGFANTLIRYAAVEDPSHVGVCFDAAMTSFRNEVEPEYKAQRGETPEDLEPQFDLCHEISIALGFATYEVDNYEADDLLGTLCSEVISRRGRARVLTTDRIFTSSYARMSASSSTISRRTSSMTQTEFARNSVYHHRRSRTIWVS